MGKRQNDSGFFWVDKSLTCNGCKFLNFNKAGCRRNQPPGEVRSLTTYLNGGGFIAVLKPADCDFQPNQNRKKANEPVEAEKE